MQQPILVLENIAKRFGDTEVLNGIDLVVYEGEFITLLGSSGCGKTTTLRIIAGLETPDEGRVVLEGRDVTGLAPNLRDVNTVFQNYALFPHMTVEANVGYSLKLKKQPKADIKKAVDEALQLVQLAGYEKRMPAELSGGQRQRVAIARAIVNRPKILLLDEPLGALDLQLRRQMQVELKKIQQQVGITFIYITHDQEEALNMSDRIAVMRGGGFEQIGTPAEVYDTPKTAYVASFVGNGNLLRGTAGRQDGPLVELVHAAGSLPVTGEAAEGSAICAAVRSEHVEMTPCTDPPAGHLQGTITGKSFAGGQLRITAALAGGAEIVEVRHGIDSPMKIGECVRVRFAPECATLVEDNLDEN